MRMVLRMKCRNFVLAAEIPCEWTFATKFCFTEKFHLGINSCNVRVTVREKCSKNSIRMVFFQFTHCQNLQKHWLQIGPKRNMAFSRCPAAASRRFHNRKFPYWRASSCELQGIRRQIPWAFLGTTEETKTPFLAPCGPTFEWLKVA